MGGTVVSQFLVLQSCSSPRLFAPSLSCAASTLIHSHLSRPSIRACTTSAAIAPATSSDASPPPTPLKKRIVSGVQPTGSIHLGNYFGAIKNWVALQNTYETLYFIVDLHAITLPYDAQDLSKATRSTAAIYLACGVDPSKASVFVQSHVRAHVELMWLLSSATPIGWLNKMIQFKEKSRKAGDEEVGVALLTRGGSLFKVPEPLIPPAGARIMSLTDGLSKMSKSAPSDQSRINILDPKDLIANKIKRCKTDSFPGMEFDNPERPECTNLLSIYQLISGKSKEEVVLECQNMNWGTFKPLLTDALIDHLHPIQVRYTEIMSDSGYLDEVLANGARTASEIADATLHNVYQAMGFLRRP